jgi:hypothetical protein
MRNLLASIIVFLFLVLGMGIGYMLYPQKTEIKKDKKVAVESQKLVTFPKDPKNYCMAIYDSKTGEWRGCVPLSEVMEVERTCELGLQVSHRVPEGCE